MSDTKHSAGDVVFLDTSQAAAYVSRESDGHYRWPELHEGDEENEPSYGRPLLVPRVYKDPPEDRYSAEVVRLRDQKDALQTQLIQLEGQLHAAKQERARQLREIEKHPDLTRLSDYIAGRITHVLHIQYSTLKITTFEEAFVEKGEHRRQPGMKLLTLYSAPYSGVTAYLNAYSDGSGSDNHIVPCFSQEDALAKAQEFINGKVAEWRKNPEKWWGGYLGGYVESAKQLGLPVPEDAADYIRARVLESLEENVRKKTADLQESQTMLDILRAGGDA